jgi:hypothetical protein
MFASEGRDGSDGQSHTPQEPALPDQVPEAYRISRLEAGVWWRQSTAEGALLNRMMLLFIVIPIVLVFQSYYALSLFVFVLMVPYGLLLRHLAVRAVRRRLQERPEECAQFLQAGVISR